MKLRSLSLTVLAMGLFAATRADATVEALLDYTIVYAQPQTGDLCLRTMPMRAEIGIPPASLMRGVFAPVQIFNENGRPTPYVNINVVAQDAGLVPTYEADAFESDGTLVYRMTLDVSELSARNGTTVAGRQKTIERAKLGLIAMAKSLEGIAEDGRYKLYLTFRGLPSQARLAGTPLYATTMYPYTSGSPLLAQYQAELIDVQGTCRQR